jgi:hypothetical protein
MPYEPGNTCEICSEEKDVLQRCRMCGANICKTCQVVEEMLCINCRDARCQICGEYLASRACNTCGKLVCEDHGIKVNESTLCDNCWTSEE